MLKRADDGQFQLVWERRPDIQQQTNKSIFSLLAQKSTWLAVIFQIEANFRPKMGRQSFRKNYYFDMRA